LLIQTISAIPPHPAISSYDGKKPTFLAFIKGREGKWFAFPPSACIVWLLKNQLSVALLLLMTMPKVWPYLNG
jgi:hypothetical protein